MFCLSLYGGLFLTGVEAFELAQTPKTSCRSRRVVRDYHDDEDVYKRQVHRRFLNEKPRNSFSPEGREFRGFYLCFVG